MIEGFDYTISIIKKYPYKNALVSYYLSCRKTNFHANKYYQNGGSV